MQVNIFYFSPPPFHKKLFFLSWERFLGHGLHVRLQVCVGQLCPPNVVWLGLLNIRLILGYLFARALKPVVKVEDFLEWGQGLGDSWHVSKGSHFLVSWYKLQVPLSCWIFGVVGFNAWELNAMHSISCWIEVGRWYNTHIDLLCFFNCSIFLVQIWLSLIPCTWAGISYSAWWSGWNSFVLCACRPPSTGEGDEATNPSQPANHGSAALHQVIPLTPFLTRCPTYSINYVHCSQNLFQQHI